MAERLTDVATSMPAAERAILVCHSPPYGLGLNITSRGEDVGSRAVLNWIERQQPLLTLHGHIHESPAMTRIHTATVGRTVVHQPGQTGGVQGRITASLIRLSVTDPRVQIQRLTLT